MALVQLNNPLVKVVIGNWSCNEVELRSVSEMRRWRLAVFVAVVTGEFQFTPEFRTWVY
jgi:hypothetical protein